MNITNEEFKEQILDSFIKVKKDPRDYIQIYCVDDVENRFVIEIGQGFQYINNCHITVHIGKYDVLEQFKSPFEFVSVLYYEWKKISFIDIYDNIQNYDFAIDS